MHDCYTRLRPYYRPFLNEFFQTQKDANIKVYSMSKALIGHPHIQNQPLNSKVTNLPTKNNHHGSKDSQMQSIK